MKLSKILTTAVLLCCVAVLHAECIQRVLPVQVSGIGRETVSLNGEWKVRLTPSDGWERVSVPGELVMQGLGIRHDQPVMYRRMVSVPSDYKGKSVILRFDGVYSYARLWVNGKYVTDHAGGFTRWEADITDCVKPGKANEIKVEVTDKLNDISYASGYAHHPIGGILRDVTLYALPKVHVLNFVADAIPDTAFQHGALHIAYAMTGDAELSFSLRDREQGAVKLESGWMKAVKGENRHQFEVKSPRLWDAEHPNLYVLEVKVKSASGEYTFTRELGFRKIEIVKDRMLVNGKQVKLRGACRHDIHPTLGRSTNAELDSLDAVLYKRSNMNFVRTSHYPPTERFLQYCDRVGLYVECETAVCFVQTHRQKNYAPGNSQNDEAYTHQYLGQVQEMAAMGRTHASVLFWSIGNESTYGRNFQLCYDWLKKEDTTRPVIYSYPGLVEKGKNVFDILSMHYPPCNGNMGQYGISVSGFQGGGKPALFDEWAHVPCYTYTTLQDDPNIRSFWALSLDKMWSNLFDAPGGLGGAIWCYSDETFMVPVPKKGTPFWIEFARTSKPKDFTGNCVGYGEWGIVDVWRREKPEFWGTKKAYSPVKTLQTTVADFVSGGDIVLPVYNRFDHTNLNELKVKALYRGHEVAVKVPDVKPHQKGMVLVSAMDWKAGESFQLEYYAADGSLIDAETITLGAVKTVMADNAVAGGILELDEDAGYYYIRGNGFTASLNKQTGLLENVTAGGKVVIEKGPFLNLDLNVNHLTGPEVRQKAKNYIVCDADWKLGRLECKKSGNEVCISVSGAYAGIGMEIDMKITPDGTLNLNYRTKGEPNGWLRESGLKFYLSDELEQLEWQRKGHWSYYPEGACDANSGKMPLYNEKQVRYGENPSQPWAMDCHNYYYFADRGAISNRPLTNGAKGMKENIYSYLLTSAGKGGLEVLSAGGELGCRMNRLADEQLVLYVNNCWDYPEIGWGDYCKELEVTPVFGTIRISLKH